MTVYVVHWTEGKQEIVPGLEHGIEGIYLNRDDAERIASADKTYLSYFIEEFVVDA